MDIIFISFQKFLYVGFLYQFRYVRFINSRRAEVKQQHPHLTFAEITKILGSEWSNLLAEEKQV